MKIKSVSGVTCYARNLEETARFYEALGFETRKRDEDHITLYSNWFWIDFISADKEEGAGFEKGARLGDSGAGMSLYLSVENVDEFYRYLLTRELEPASAPQDTRGNREFLIYDPDGYRLVIFKRK